MEPSTSRLDLLARLGLTLGLVDVPPALNPFRLHLLLLSFDMSGQIPDETLVRVSLILFLRQPLSRSLQLTIALPSSLTVSTTPSGSRLGNLSAWPSLVSLCHRIPPAINPLYHTTTVLRSPSGHAAHTYRTRRHPVAHAPPHFSPSTRYHEFVPVPRPSSASDLPRFSNRSRLSVLAPRRTSRSSGPRSSARSARSGCSSSPSSSSATFRPRRALACSRVSARCGLLRFWGGGRSGRPARAGDGAGVVRLRVDDRADLICLPLSISSYSGSFSSPDRPLSRSTLSSPRRSIQRLSTSTRRCGDGHGRRCSFMRPIS